ncbi:MAG: DUF1634 domain-containing protein [Candidatus Geothermarchaeales archaeon]
MSGFGSENFTMGKTVSMILRHGVLLSIAVMVFGLCLAAVTGNTDYPRGNVSLTWLTIGLSSLNPAAIIFLGFLVLIATPVLRVSISILIYHHMKDRVYTLITTVVLLILLLSFLVGAA